MTAITGGAARLRTVGDDGRRNGLRVALTRRGNEHIVVALRVTSIDRREALVGRMPMTGEELSFRLDDIDSFQVLD